MIDPMATGTANRPSGDLRRPRGREALSTHPPTPVDDTPRGSLEQRAENTSTPANLGVEQSRDRAPAPRCRHSAHPRPDRRLPRRVLHGRRPRRGSSRRRPQRHRSALPYRPRTARRRLRRLRVRPTSVELYDALRADNPTSRQRSIATVLINEASFEDLVNAHTKGAFTWRQLARAAQRQGAVPPPRIRLINAFATPPPRPENRWRA